ncbi:BnaC01g23110D [Brassica napus]|uniref:DUF4283 domain-containing protein n=2 Tax=Brassica TaxID=3705 RepID=A0A0D3A891_BRAOL|nr:unnamed protein product [Brassica napus]CDY16276.1 BnaC01g23110D [Brassica napus]
MGSFNRFSSARMADNKGKGNLLEDEDEPIRLVDDEDPHTIREYRMSLIGKVLNPKKQNVEKLISHMPTQWGVQDRVTADDLGNGKFLFNFSSEEDIISVLQQGPFHYNLCMFVLVHWEPIVHDEYPWIIPFWVEINGIPLHLWTVKNLRSIGGKRGYIDTMELSAGRLLVDVDTRKPLIFTKKASSPEGDEVSIHFTYDKLFKHCKYCGFLSHEEALCPKKQEDLRQKSKQTCVFSRVQLPTDSHSHQPLLRDSHERDRYHDHVDRNMNLRNAYTRAGYEASNRGYCPDRHSRRQEGNRWSRPVSRHSHRYAPYEHTKQLTWRGKNKYVEQKGDESFVKNNENHASKNQGLMPSSSYIGQKEQPHDKRSSGKKIASTIFTPSRDESTNDDNVTFRYKGITRAIDVSHTANVVSNDEEEGQILGALQDMDMGEAAIIVAPQQEAWMECDGQSDDLLGEELNELEMVPSSHQVDQGSTEAVKKTSGKRSTSSKGTSRSRVPHGLPSKKAEFFCRGSPRKRNAISIGLPPYGETDEHGQPRPSSSKKAKASSRHSRGLEGPQKPPDFIHEDTQLELSRDWERPHSSTPYGDVSEASPKTYVSF